MIRLKKSVGSLPFSEAEEALWVTWATPPLVLLMTTPLECRVEWKVLSVLLIFHYPFYQP